MIEATWVSAVVLPVVFGLFGFIEPCSIGATLIAIKQIEGRTPSQKVVQTLVFAATRALFIGLLGLVAAVLGSAFLGFQKAAWFVLGAVYIRLGIVYLSGRAGLLMRRLGPGLHRLRSARGAVALGLLFGLNIPACVAPLLLALLAAAATGSAGASNLIQGFISLALFGLALSLPLVAAVFFARALCSICWLHCPGAFRVGPASSSCSSARGPSGFRYSSQSPPADSREVNRPCRCGCCVLNPGTPRRCRLTFPPRQGLTSLDEPSQTTDEGL